MKVVVGLGNPGSKYDRTRHNIGFMVVDAVASRFKSLDLRFKKKFNAEVGEVKTNNGKVLLVKPMTYMNKSGESVRRVVDYCGMSLTPGDSLRKTPGVAHEDALLIVQDELDFLMGEMKISRDKSAGGHNGVQSVIDHLGTRDFVRFRVGVQARDCDITTKQKAKDYLLSNFTKKDMEVMQPVIEKTAEAVIYAIEKGVGAAMNKFNNSTIQQSNNTATSNS